MKETLLPVYNIEKFKPLCNEKDFYANKISTHLKNHDFIYKPHKHDFYFVIICTKGKGTHWIDFIEYEIKPGAVFIISPGKGHSFVHSEDAEGFVFFHTKDFYELHSTSKKLVEYPFYYSNYNTPLIQIDKKSINRILPVFKEILEEYRSKQLMKFNRLFVLVELLYIDLLRLYVPLEQIEKQNQNYLIKLHKLEELIEGNFISIKLPAQYADLMSMSVKQLNRICKECLNKSTSDLISDRIVLEAKRLLVYSSLTISEIAEEIGYTDISYFSRLFKKKTGKTPVNFLKEIR
jgi:AraC-like DNA-binding protein/mannose-6-phosphate isomerase-like protein (cupin superfamily)